MSNGVPGVGEVGIRQGEGESSSEFDVRYDQFLQAVQAKDFAGMTSTLNTPEMHEALNHPEHGEAFQRQLLDAFVAVAPQTADQMKVAWGAAKADPQQAILAIVENPALMRAIRDIEKGSANIGKIVEAIQAPVAGEIAALKEQKKGLLTELDQRDSLLSKMDRELADAKAELIRMKAEMAQLRPSNLTESRVDKNEQDISVPEQKAADILQQPSEPAGVQSESESNNDDTVNIQALSPEASAENAWPNYFEMPQAGDGVSIITSSSTTEPFTLHAGIKPVNVAYIKRTRLNNDGAKRQHDIQIVAITMPDGVVKTMSCDYVDGAPVSEWRLYKQEYQSVDDERKVSIKNAADPFNQAEYVFAREDDQAAAQYLISKREESRQQIKDMTREIVENATHEELQNRREDLAAIEQFARSMEKAETLIEVWRSAYEKNRNIYALVNDIDNTKNRDGSTNLQSVISRNLGENGLTNTVSSFMGVVRQNQTRLINGNVRHNFHNTVNRHPQYPHYAEIAQELQDGANIDKLFEVAEKYGPEVSKINQWIDQLDVFEQQIDSEIASVARLIDQVASLKESDKENAQLWSDVHHFLVDRFTAYGFLKYESANNGRGADATLQQGLEKVVPKQPGRFVLGNSILGGGDQLGYKPRTAENLSFTSLDEIISDRHIQEVAPELGIYCKWLTAVELTINNANAKPIARKEYFYSTKERRLGNMQLLHAIDRFVFNPTPSFGRDVSEDPVVQSALERYQEKQTELQQRLAEEFRFTPVQIKIGDKIGLGDHLRDFGIDPAVDEIPSEDKNLSGTVAEIKQKGYSVIDEGGRKLPLQFARVSRYSYKPDLDSPSLGVANTESAANDKQVEQENQSSVKIESCSLEQVIRGKDIAWFNVNITGFKENTGYEAWLEDQQKNRVGLQLQITNQQPNAAILRMTNGIVPVDFAKSDNRARLVIKDDAGVVKYDEIPVR